MTTLVSLGPTKAISSLDLFLKNFTLLRIPLYISYPSKTWYFLGSSLRKVCMSSLMMLPPVFLREFLICLNSLDGIEYFEWIFAKISCRLRVSTFVLSNAKKIDEIEPIRKEYTNTPTNIHEIATNFSVSVTAGISP